MPFEKAELWMVEKIVTSLDADGNGFMDTEEIKVLISKITGIPTQEIPDDHREVRFSRWSSVPRLSVQSLGARAVKHFRGRAGSEAALLHREASH